ncbi:hypothetical protein AB0M02_20505 [Actinoplanes sp. NPDC051861]|uniref:hypothetical protein n=1 Tax=Actinoplanes sp. NPDC051861 TaxID=3155170 RepID=UPI0034220762
MEFDPLRSPENLIRDSRDELRRALRVRPLPVAVLMGADDLPAGRLGGWEATNGLVNSVTITFGAAGAPGPWVTVETTRWGGTTISAAPLRQSLEHHMRTREDRFSAVAWTGEDGTVTVDGRTVAGHLLRAGDRWWALRCWLRDLEITVVAHDWHSPASLHTLTEPELHQLISAVPAPPPPPQPAPPLPELPGEPHKLLVEALLRADREHATPRLPQEWGVLWRAAVLRQADLADQPEHEAERLLRMMLDQLTNLQHQATWFRLDEPLRNRAVDETLLFCTGLSTDVPSRPAQVAWLRRQGLRPGEHARIESLNAAKLHWLDAWQSWADAQLP